MIREPAPAKVNLTLRVGALREDNYHPVDSIVVFADQGDALHVEPADTLSLSVEGPCAAGVPDGEDNLVLKAVRLLAAASGHEAKGRIRLDKQIPAGAGLGGGSADAAAALRAFNRLWALDWPLDMLAGLGAEIGSDVPACVWSQPLRMSGRGERIRLIADWPAFPALLVNPDIPVSTGLVFAAFDAMPGGTGAGFRLTGGMDRFSILSDLDVAGNDLTGPACTVAPVIRDVLGALEASENAALVRMSGSGATCFAIYPDTDSRDIAARNIGRDHPDWLIFPVVFQGAGGISGA